MRPWGKWLIQDDQSSYGKEEIKDGTHRKERQCEDTGYHLQVKEKSLRRS